MAAACLAVMFLQTAPGCSPAPTGTPEALIGQVTSAEEGPMEGVLVSAKKTGSTITVTVVSDAQGQYRFPQAKLEPGQYALSTRAVEYELQGPVTVDVIPEETATADLTLLRVPGSGLTNTEWILSVTKEEEKEVLRNQQCVRCHTLERTVRSQYTEDEWVEVITRMASYTTNSGANAPPQDSPNAEEILAAPSTEQRLRQAKILAGVNLSSGPQHSYELKTLPRPNGRATQVVYTEYDLPEFTRQPHDVIVDSEGVVWYNDFSDQLFGRLDPATGEVKEFPLPLLDPEETRGSLCIRFDRDENIWIGMFYQSAIAKFDRKTEQLEVFRIPPDLRAQGRGGRARLTEVSPGSSHVDGKVWLINSEMSGMHRLELATETWETFQPFPDDPVNIYDVLADSQNNAYFLAFGAEHIGTVNAKTGEITVYPTPTRNSRPRRGSVDEQDRLWFGEHNGDRIGMFDPRTEQIQEWKLPTSDSFPYDAVADKNGHAWTGGMYSDRVARLNPETGEFIEYLLPRSTNIRRVWVDNATTLPTFWVGSHHGASIIKLEPLDAVAPGAETN
jgi:streptogramin lyase